MAEDMNPSGSDDDDEVASDDDDGELPAPLPLAMLGGAADKKVASKPKATPKLPAPLKLAKKPPAALGAGPPLPVRPSPAVTKSPPPPVANGDTEETPTKTASDTNSHDDDNSDDDDDKITTPASMPPHRAIAEPAANDDDVVEPFDAAKAAEQARKAAVGGTVVNGSGGPAAASTAAVSPPAERKPGVVDEALRSLVLMLKGEKNDSLAQVPMELCVHGLVKDDEGKTWPPYEISLPESRKSQTSRQTWLTEKMQEDPNRLLNTILFFNVDPDAVLDPKSITTASEHKIQAMLPGTLVNPDGNADAAKRIAEYNEAIGSTEWTFAIPVPLPFVKTLYKMHKHGLPTLYSPVTNDKVRFQLFSKVEDHCSKDGRWKLIVDKSREGQASAAAANGGAGGGRGKRAAPTANGGEEGAATKKRANTAKPAAAATAADALESVEEPPPAGVAMPAAPPAFQTTLNFPPAAAGRAVVPEVEEATDTATPTQQPPPMALALRPPAASASTPAFVQTPLNWTAISPEWYSIIVPKLPEGFVAEVSAPTTHCCGMVSFKRSSNHPLDM